MNNKITEVSVDLIDDPKLAMRGDVHDEGIDALVASIKSVGLLEPLVVRSNGARYELIAGHRRLTALKIIGKVLVLATVMDVSEDEGLIMRMHENSHRENVNPVDEAVYIGQVMHQLNLNVNDIAGKLNRSVSYVYDRLAILEFPDYLIEYVGQKKISISAAIALNKVNDPITKKNFCDYAAKDGVTLERANAWASMANVGAITSDTTAEQLQAIAEPEKHNETMISCARCKEAAKISNMVTVWIHKVCPDGNEVVS